MLYSYPKKYLITTKTIRTLTNLTKDGFVAANKGGLCPAMRRNRLRKN